MRAGSRAAYEGWLADVASAWRPGPVGALAGARVLVTGANGLIGSALADALLLLSRDLGLGLSVTLASRRPVALGRRMWYWEGSYAPARFDALTGEVPAGRFDLVFHCASNAHPAAYASEPVETAMTNVTGTHALLASLADAGEGRLVYVSSSEVYGRGPVGARYREGDSFPVDTLDPRSCYPTSKRMAESLCASFLAEHGVDSVVARPGHVYGPCASPSDSRAHAQFARSAASGEPVVLKSAGVQLRSWVHVADCASALVAIALLGASGEAYNVASAGSEGTVAQLARALAEVGGVPLEGGAASEGERAGYNRAESSAVDPSRLESLGWRPAFDLDRGARRTVEVMRSGAFGSTDCDGACNIQSGISE